MGGGNRRYHVRSSECKFAVLICPHQKQLKLFSTEYGVQHVAASFSSSTEEAHWEKTSRATLQEVPITSSAVGGAAQHVDPTATDANQISSTGLRQLM